MGFESDMQGWQDLCPIYIHSESEGEDRNNEPGLGSVFWKTYINSVVL